MTNERWQEPAFNWRAITPEDSPKSPLDLMADPLARDLSTAKLREGELAFDFELALYDFRSGHERATGETFRLQEMARDRPVALIFGSYT